MCVFIYLTKLLWWFSINCRSRGWFIKNATVLVILLKMNIYSTFSASFSYHRIIWDIKTSKNFFFHFGLSNWLILSTFKCLKTIYFYEFYKIEKKYCFWVLSYNFSPGLGTEIYNTLKLRYAPKKFALLLNFTLEHWKYLENDPLLSHKLCASFSCKSCKMEKRKKIPFLHVTFDPESK